MTNFFFWSGIIAWGCLAVVGIFLTADQVIEWIITHIWTKREFLAFVADRLRASAKSGGNES